jgi:hypothetical protein
MSCCWISRVRETRNVRFVDDENPFAKTYLPSRTSLPGHQVRGRLLEGPIMTDISQIQALVEAKGLTQLL